MLTASHIFIRWDIAFLKDADSRRPCHAHGREARCCPRLRGGIIHVTIIRVHGKCTPLATAGVATTRKGWADYDLHDRKALPANRTKLSESYGTFWLVGTGSPISLISSCWANLWTSLGQPVFWACERRSESWGRLRTIGCHRSFRVLAQVMWMTWFLQADFEDARKSQPQTLTGEQPPVCAGFKTLHAPGPNDLLIHV